MQTVRYQATLARTTERIPAMPRFRLLRDRLHADKWVIDDTSLDSNTSPCSTSIPIIRLRRNPADLRRSEMRVGRIRRNSLERDDQTSARTRRCRRNDACYGDPYMIEYFLGTVTDNALLEIRRERGCRLILENVRWDDDMRWGMGKLADGPGTASM